MAALAQETTHLQTEDSRGRLQKFTRHHRPSGGGVTQRGAILLESQRARQRESGWKEA